jgi:hypothetical protein
MRKPFVCRLTVMLLLVMRATPSFAHAQPDDRNDHDRLWNGMLIGAAFRSADERQVLEDETDVQSQEIRHSA